MKPYGPMPPKLSYNAVRHEPHDWDYLEEHFADLTESGWDQRPMSELVRHIRANYADDRLFAYQSMATLVVNNYRPREWLRDSLMIDHFADEAKVTFRFYSMPFSKVEFERTYDPSRICEKFDNFIRMIRW